MSTMSASECVFFVFLNVSSNLILLHKSILIMNICKQ